MAWAFEDIVDGYFPLQVSLGDLMRRHGLVQARLSLSHAPIIEVPGLAPEAPVPLSIRAARAGMILEAAFLAQMHGSEMDLAGQGRWHWFDAPIGEAAIDPMTRLAEPVIVAVQRL